MPKKIDYKKSEIKQWLDSIISKGISSGASDIHIEPFQDLLRVRFRIDGILREVDSIPLTRLEPVISMLKIMANLDIAEQRTPQDGHIVFHYKTPTIDKSIDLRLSIFPSIFGEVAVIRILNRKDLLFDKIGNIGMESDDLKKMQNTLKQSGGMVLVTGPVASGKTTTLYTILNSLQSSERNIITLEDPIELYLNGVRQCQIRPAIGFNFPQGLRSILRQDPNIVMVGEIRDDETLEISIRAALSGVLFFSTMHTTNSIGAIIRFIELGLPRSVIAFALRAVIAQRLVRTICPHCKTKAMPSKETLELCGISKGSESKLFIGKGCNACFKTGYIGRSGIFEAMFINKEIQKLIIEGASFTEIEAQARENGMKTLREIAIEKTLKGETTLDEIIRVAVLD
jgi:type IV pilus assembly protein PilB